MYNHGVCIRLVNIYKMQKGEHYTYPKRLCCKTIIAYDLLHTKGRRIFFISQTKLNTLTMEKCETCKECFINFDIEFM